LAAVAGVLPGRPADDAGTVTELAASVLHRLSRLLALRRPDGAEYVGGEKEDVDVELMAVSIGGAAEALQLATLNEGPLADALAGIGALLLRVTTASASNQPLAAVPADTLAQLLRLGVLQSPAVVDASSGWPGPLAAALAPRLGDVASPRLAELSVALAASEVNSVEHTGLSGIFEALQGVVVARAPSMTATEFGTVAKALASVSVLEESLLEAFDVEAQLVQPVQPDDVAAIAWSMAVADTGSDAAWMLVAAQVESGMAEWRLAAAPTRGLLFEALAAHRELHSITWEGAAADVLSSAEWLADWHQLRLQVAPPSAHGDLVAQLLAGQAKITERNQEGSEGIYVMPFTVTESKVVLDLMPSSGRHPVSRAFRGESQLRHSVWSACGRSVLAVPDSVWVDLAKDPSPSKAPADAEAVAEATKQRQLTWLRAQLGSLGRADIVREAGLQPETDAKLAGVPFGEGPKDIGIDALKTLASHPEDVRDLAVKWFLETWQDAHIRKPTAWFIGTIKKAQLYVEKGHAMQGQEKESLKEMVDASARGLPVKKPMEGWTHAEGRPLAEVKLGERVRGLVTNVIRDRVWVNVGCAKDATFKAVAMGTYKIGDEVKGLKVVSIDEAGERLEVEVPEKRPRAKASSGVAPKQAAPDAEAAEAADGETKAKSAAAKAIREAAAGAKRGDEKPPKKPRVQRPKIGDKDTRVENATLTKKASDKDAPEKLRAAVKPRPTEGWGHEGARGVAEVVVGELLEGKVTNVMYNRVWVNIGAARDASFIKKADVSYKIGAKVAGLSVKSVGLDKEHILLQGPETAELSQPVSYNKSYFPKKAKAKAAASAS